MFIRFVISSLDEDSGRRQGLFQAAAELEDAGELYSYELEQLDRIRGWFNENMERPSSFRRSRKYHTLNVALSWFKAEAKAHIAKMYDLAALLENHGVRVEVIRAERPGYIVYEDAHQATAEPYAETGT